TTATEADVDSFLNGVADVQQRADAFQMLEIMKEITGQPPRMWGPTMVGFGEHHYVYDSGHEGDTFLTGFSPRKGALALSFLAARRRRRAAPNRLKTSSTITLTRITTPMMANSSRVGKPSKPMAFDRNGIRAAPSMTPSTEPSPPRRLQPPSTAAAMAYSS